ncbi:MAG: PAS domain-containing protein [Bacteroidota bacterium]
MNFPFVQSLAGHFGSSHQYYFIITDTKGYIIHANPLFSKKSGYHQPAFLPLSDFIAESDIEKYNTAVNECNQRPGDAVVTGILCRHRDGSYFRISWELSLLTGNDNESDHIQWIGTAINAGEQQEKGYRDEQERYEAYEYSAEGLWKIELRIPVSITKTADEILAHCRENGYMTDCNDNMARMYGFSKAEDMIGLSVNELIDPYDPRANNLIRFIRNDYRLSGVETKEYDRNGNVLYFLNNMRGIVENGMLKRIWGTQQDITEQKKTEELLQESELFYRNLIADSLDGMMLTDEKGLIGFASGSVKKILGYEPEMLLEKNAFEFIHPDDRSHSWAAFTNEVKKMPQAKFINARILKESGEWLWCMVRGHNMLDNPHVNAVLIYFSDDTLRRNAETALVEGDKRFRQLINNLSLGVILLRR